MTTEKDIPSALKRSASHNEIVRVNVAFFENGLRAVGEMADIDDSAELDDLSSDRRYVDVWGKTREGHDFRLYLFAE